MKILYVVVVIILATVINGITAETNAWKNDFVAFRAQLEKGETSLGTPGEEIAVTWEATYRGIKPDPKSKNGVVQVVQFDLGPVVTPTGKAELKFICEKQDAEKWKSVKSGTKVRFAAQWTHFFTASSKQPKSTLFFNVQLKDVLPSDPGVTPASK